MDKATYTLYGGFGPDGEELSTGWRTPFLPRLEDTIFLPDRDAADHPWHAMVIRGVMHYPNKTEFVVASTDEQMTEERLANIFAQAQEFFASTTER